MRTCPNLRCRMLHDDSVNQCPECGAPMAREADKPQDPNAHLAWLKANAGMKSPVGAGGGVRSGSEPNYADTAAVKEVALQVLGGMNGE